MPAEKGQFLGTDMKPRKDRRFKQWNKTKITPMIEPRTSSRHSSVEAFTFDLSLGGARIHTAESFEVGTPLRLQIELVRTGETLRVEGIVKWRQRNETEKVFEMGVEFQHTSMVTVLGLMKDLHDGRRPSPSKMDEPAILSRS
jgi:Tfp pilus assembly protein PilZ